MNAALPFLRMKSYNEQADSRNSFVLRLGGRRDAKGKRNKIS